MFKKFFVRLLLILLLFSNTVPYKWNHVNAGASLPNGVQNFTGYSFGNGIGTSPDGFFELSAKKSGNTVGSELKADEFGAYIFDNSSNNITSYLEIKAINGLGHFILEDLDVGEYHYSSSIVGSHFKDITIKGYMNGTEVFATTPYQEISGGETLDFPINYAPAQNMEIDSFRVYFTNVDSTPIDVFNLVAFKIGNAAPESPKSTNADLSDLNVDDGFLLNPVFTSGTMNYTVSVPYGTENIEISPTLADSKATVTINGVQLVSGQSSTIIHLEPDGSTAIQIVVTAEDGTTKKTYSVTVNETPRSNNADLSQLTISEGTLNPVFSPGTTSYDVLVSNSTEWVSVTPTAADITSNIKVNGSDVQSGKDSLPFDLSNVGQQQIAVQVTAEDLSTKTYTVNVHRNELPILTDVNFSLDESAIAGTKIGVLSGTDVDGDALSYKIISGNTENLFSLNSETGEMTVAASGFDYEVTTSYSLTVEVTDGTDKNTAIVTIDIKDVNEHAPIPSGFSTSIDENTINGTYVGKVTATDLDKDSEFTFSIVSEEADGAFRIDPNSGEIYVADETLLDYETKRSFTYTVQVSDGLHKNDASVTIDLVNVNDNKPTIENEVFSVNENALNGTIIGSVIGTDADGDPLTYHILSGNESGIFKINPNTGEIYVEDGTQLDFEKKTFYELEIQARDEDISYLSLYPFLNVFNSSNNDTRDVAIVRINVMDLNDNDPEPIGFTASIDENSSDGTFVGTVTASDADAGSNFTYQITSGNVGDIFKLDSESGEITVADGTKLDYETMNKYVLTIQVSDGVHTSLTTVTVHLNNLNDNTPTIGNEIFTVDENSLNGTLIGTVHGLDADGDTLFYKIISGNDSSIFKIDSLTGDISVLDSSQLDYEMKTTYELSIQVTDTNVLLPIFPFLPEIYPGISGNSDIATIKINVNDLNDNSPIPNGFTKEIDENTVNGTSVGLVTVYDADADSKITYDIISGNTEKAFAINQDTGEITVADETKLDYEKIKNFHLSVQVSDGKNIGEAVVTIPLKNVNDNKPQIESKRFTIDENSPKGTNIGTVNGIDLDGDTLEYSIISGNEAGVFAVESSSGEITVVDQTKLDYEKTHAFSIIVQANDGVHTASSTVQISLNNKNDNSPVVADGDFSIEENAAMGTLVGQVSANDADGDVLEYSITSGNEFGVFAIDSSDGVISVVNQKLLDYELIKDFALSVKVDDGKQSSASKIKVHIQNINDNSPIVKDTTFIIDESAVEGTLVGTVGSYDLDGDEITFHIESGNSDGVFTINEETGEISVADNELLDAETIASYTLEIVANDGMNNSSMNVMIEVLSNDATLSNLESSTGEFTPVFDSETTMYSMSVGDNVTELKLTPTVNGENATIKINGKETLSGVESRAISLNPGKNMITIDVTAQNGETKTYTVEVLRLKPTISVPAVNRGGRASVLDSSVNELDEKGHLIVDLKGNLEDVRDVQFTSNQLSNLIEKQAMISLIKEDIEVHIPAINFTKGKDLFISLVKQPKDSKREHFSGQSASSIYDLTIHWGDQIISHFDYDIELVFPVEKGKNTNPEKLRVYYWNEDTNKWDEVGGVYEKGLIKAMTNHFSTFGVFHPDAFIQNENGPGDTNLPETATNMFNWILAGILLIILGASTLRLRRKML